MPRTPGVRRQPSSRRVPAPARRAATSWRSRERKPSSVTCPLGIEVECDEVRSRAYLDSGLVEPERTRGAGGHASRASSPASTMPGYDRGVCRARQSDVSSPVTPNGASSNGTSFSCRACGAWSVAMHEIAPRRRRVAERLAVLARSQRRVHLRVRVERADCLLGEHEVMRRDLGGRADAGCRGRGRALRTDSRAERCIRWRGRPSAPASERSRSTITLSAVDGYGPRPELRGHRPFVRVPAARERRLLAVKREPKVGDGAVLERTPHERPPRRRDDRRP